jgi:cytochrome P450
MKFTAVALAYSLLSPTTAFQTGTTTLIIPTTPPSPPKFPLIGTLPDFLLRGGVSSLSQIYTDMYTEYGPVFSLSLMNREQLIFSDPRVYDQVFKAEGKYPIGAAEEVSTFNTFYEKNNLKMALKGVARGEEWKEWRGALEDDMYKSWEGYIPTIANVCRQISQVAGREDVEFETFLSRAAFDMFTSVMIGESLQTTDGDVATVEDIEFVKATQAAFDTTGKLLSNPLEAMFGGDLQGEFDVNMEKTYRFANRMNKRAAEEASALQKTVTAENNSGESSESKCPISAIKSKFASPSFVERLVHRGKLSNDEIAEIAAPLLMAGVDTTAYVMSWLYLNLASNPEAQTKLAAELKTVLNGADITTKEQMDSLPYLKACIRESHRLTPATPIVVKMLDKDIDMIVPTTSNDKPNAYHAKAGTRICLNLRGIPMDPQYVDNPTEYRPERFLPGAIQARKGTPSEIIDHAAFADPFGRGKRRCLGSNVANAEIMILAARLFQDWEIALKEDNVEWKAAQKLMLKADPYPAVRLSRRV